MSQTRWTPGGWDWGPAAYVDDDDFDALRKPARVFAVLGGTSRDIAEVGLDRVGEANANARLIASAPNLAAVVQRFCAFCHQAGIKADACSLDPVEQLHAWALAALARAGAPGGETNGAPVPGTSAGDARDPNDATKGE